MLKQFSARVFCYGCGVGGGPWCSLLHSRHDVLMKGGGRFDGHLSRGTTVLSFISLAISKY